MLRRSFVGLFVLALVWSLTLSAQTMKPKIVDINSAPEADIAAVGIDKTVA